MLKITIKKTRYSHCQTVYYYCFIWSLCTTLLCLQKAEISINAIGSWLLCSAILYMSSLNLILWHQTDAITLYEKIWHILSIKNFYLNLCFVEILGCAQIVYWRHWPLLATGGSGRWSVCTQPYFFKWNYLGINKTLILIVFI